MNVFPFLNEFVAQFILCRYGMTTKGISPVRTGCAPLTAHPSPLIRNCESVKFYLHAPYIHVHGAVERHTSYFIFTYAILFSFINIVSLYTISGSLCTSTLYLNTDG
jgi:hypothetical protein